MYDGRLVGRSCVRMCVVAFFANYRRFYELSYQTTERHQHRRPSEARAKQLVFSDFIVFKTKDEGKEEYGETRFSFL